MAPQGIVSNISSSSQALPADVRYKAEYGNGMEQAAADFQLLILVIWTVNTIMILLHRLHSREKPLGIEIGDYSWHLETQPTERQKAILKHLDNIFFTISYTTLSFLMVLQFIPYGTIQGG